VDQRARSGLWDVRSMEGLDHTLLLAAPRCSLGASECFSVPNINLLNEAFALAKYI